MRVSATIWWSTIFRRHSMSSLSAGSRFSDAGRVLRSGTKNAFRARRSPQSGSYPRNNSFFKERSIRWRRSFWTTLFSFPWLRKTYLFWTIHSNPRPVWNQPKGSQTFGARQCHVGPPLTWHCQPVGRFLIPGGRFQIPGGRFQIRGGQIHFVGSRGNTNKIKQLKKRRLDVFVGNLFVFLGRLQTLKNVFGRKNQKTKRINISFPRRSISFSNRNIFFSIHINFKRNHIIFKQKHIIFKQKHIISQCWIEK